MGGGAAVLAGAAAAIGFTLGHHPNSSNISMNLKSDFGKVKHEVSKEIHVVKKEALTVEKVFKGEKPLLKWPAKESTTTSTTLGRSVKPAAPLMKGRGTPPTVTPSVAVSTSILAKGRETPPTVTPSVEVSTATPAAPPPVAMAAKLEEPLAKSRETQTSSSLPPPVQAGAQPSHGSSLSAFPALLVLLLCMLGLLLCCICCVALHCFRGSYTAFAPQKSRTLSRFSRPEPSDADMQENMYTAADTDKIKPPLLASAVTSATAAVTSRTPSAVLQRPFTLSAPGLSSLSSFVSVPAYELPVATAEMAPVLDPTPSNLPLMMPLQSPIPSGMMPLQGAAPSNSIPIMAEAGVAMTPELQALVAGQAAGYTVSGVPEMPAAVGERIPIMMEVGAASQQAGLPVLAEAAGIQYVQPAAAVEYVQPAAVVEYVQPVVAAELGQPVATVV